jgi:hypothetical protein
MEFSVSTGIAYAVERDWLIISGGLHSVSLTEAARCQRLRLAPTFFAWQVLEMWGRYTCELDWGEVVSPCQPAALEAVFGCI